MDKCRLIHTHGIISDFQKLSNDSYFIGGIFANASLKILAELLHRLWSVINRDSPEGKAQYCCLC